MSWSDEIDEILAGDQSIVLAYGTPAGGVVCAPVTNFGQRDRETGTITVNSSVGMPKKLERIRNDPRVALAFHTRRHGFSDRPLYVLVQGTATLSDPIPRYPDMLGADWDRFDGPRATGTFWEWWLRIYYTRVEVRISVERVSAWPDLACRGSPETHGTPLLAQAPSSHRDPAKGTGSRIDHHAAARKIARLPDVLLGWMDADQRPFVAPVEVNGTDDTGIALTAPHDLLPAGGRRAGLTAHTFTQHVLGQHQQIHTGWLQADDSSALYMPHTRTGHRIPASRLLYRLGVGYGTRRGMRR